ncbi:hypothetical protein [Paludisphaera borealis]|uniref:Uncharacterized protein n=1 Tax=Paludisphaera borealis TaxID=1387353 RepID=A0A1U7CT90_9BACT|nr:hypothetical protein [Paludisphaera borealis]APW62128.1 hypothetical protein BSF38_03660 [Paludisphaera borealis]
MTSITRARRILLTLTACAAASLGGSTPARAQFGGMGWGIGGFNYVPSPTNFLNDHALLNAARAGRPASNNVYAGNPNSYVNRIRDNGFTPSYDVQRRRSPASSPVNLGPSLGNRTPAAPPVERTTAAAPATKTAPSLASFFDQSQTLVWPADSPISGDLKPKRDASDQSALAVLTQVANQGRATIGSATDARQKLLEYGRPALQEIRETATPVVADSFHSFLLSLYDSLRQAATAP